MPSEVEEDNKEVLKLDKEEKKAFDEEEEADKMHKNKFIRVYMLFVWVTVTVVMGWYMYQVVIQYIQATQSGPSSSITIDDPTELPMPAVIVCNWNQDGSLQNSTPSGDCPTCKLYLQYCFNFNTSTNCTDQWYYTPIQTDAGLFDCWSYNTDPYAPQFSNTTGYSGSLAVVFGLELQAENISNRAGAQVTFGVLNSPSSNTTNTTITAKDIYNEIRFAPVGKDTFYAFTYVITNHQELPMDSSEYNTTRFDTVSSLTTVLAPNSSLAYVGVSFSYQTLSRREEVFFIGYSLTNVFGDFANMVNTLMGLDAIKVSGSLPMVYFAIRVRSMVPLEDHFTW